MTLCEYFRKQFINEIRNGRDKNWIIKSNYYNFENGSFEFLKACTKYNSFARQLGTTCLISLTIKGLKALYKSYDNWQV